MRERVRPEAVPLLVEVREPQAEREHRQPCRHLVREGEESARQDGRNGERHPLTQQAEEDRTEEELFDDGDEAGAEDQIDEQPGERAVSRRCDEERLGVRADHLGLRVRDDDREEPEGDAGREPELGADRGRRPEVARPELRPGTQQDDQADAEGEVLCCRQDADLLRCELVEMAERDREDAGGDEDGEVREEEGSDGTEEDRPEAPARRVDAGGLEGL